MAIECQMHKANHMPNGSCPFCKVDNILKTFTRKGGKSNQHIKSQLDDVLKDVHQYYRNEYQDRLRLENEKFHLIAQIELINAQIELPIQRQRALMQKEAMEKILPHIAIYADASFNAYLTPKKAFLSHFIKYPHPNVKHRGWFEKARRYLMIRMFQGMLLKALSNFYGIDVEDKNFIADVMVDHIDEIKKGAEREVFTAVQNMEKEMVKMIESKMKTQELDLKKETAARKNKGNILFGTGLIGIFCLIGFHLLSYVGNIPPVSQYVTHIGLFFISIYCIWLGLRLSHNVNSGDFIGTIPAIAEKAKSSAIATLKGTKEIANEAKDAAKSVNEVIDSITVKPESQK